METEGRTSTGSTVSGVFKSLLQSPTPICMLYVSHPFGISSPVIIEAENYINDDLYPNGIIQKKRRNVRESAFEQFPPVHDHRFTETCSGKNSNCQNAGKQTCRHPKLIPWPRDTWKRDCILPPLIQVRGNHRGELVAPDLETILRTIRQAWNTPNGRNLTQSQTEEDTDTTLPSVSWRLTGTKFGIKMGSGTNATPIMSGLLRRRYSMPEIIMRKHKLAQQKSYDESPAATAPSRHSHASPSSYSFPSPTVSSRHGVTMSTGSDSNLSRRPERGEMSMRKSTLLRRIWSRELKRYDDTRSGSWSPPMRRSQRRLNANEPTESFRCEECRKLDFHNGEEDEELVPKRLRLVSNHRQVSTRTSSTITPSTENRPVSTSETPQVTSSNVTPSRHVLKLGNDAEGQETLLVEIETVDSNANVSTSDELNNNTVTSEEKSPEEKTRETTPSELREPRDSELDLFISKLLIENLKDLEAEISRDCERNNNVPVTVESCEIQSNLETDKVIYFPRYSLDSKEEMSSYTSNTSDFEFSDLPHGEIIKVTTGSTYQNLEHSQSIVVPRILGKYPRTESLEAQPSSASNVEEVEEEGNCDGSEESVSLVDSLDEARPLEQDDQSKTRDKSEAFFIPIAETPSEAPPTVPPVAEAMPAKLKEKIDQRQKERDIKREEETKKKQKQIEKIMDPKLEDDNFYEKIPTAVKKDSPVKEKPKKPVKSTNASVLRSEIGLLESYTIDSKGNMQLRAPQKSEPPKPTKKHRRSATTTTTTTTTATTTTATTTSTSTSTTTSKSSSVQGSLQTNSSTSIKPEKKTTVFQSQSDIITPDIENGPRRVYQKTEIKDGEKCIEILEIVECADSSLDSSPERPIAGGKTYRIDTPTRKSKIPIPISRSGKVDRAIAELLIDALNRPDEVGIEIVKSPKEVTKEKSTRRAVARRNTPKRTNSSSCKYHQMFEVIPEEKSSVSVDSSNEETSKKPSPKIRPKKPPSEPTKAWIGFFKNQNGRLSTAIIDEDESEAAPVTAIVEEKKEKLEVMAPSSPTECLHLKVCQKCRLPEPETTDACTITDSQLKIEIHTTTKSEETTTTTTASLSDSTPSPKIVHNQQTKRNSKVDVWRVQSPVVTHVEDTICEVDSQSFIVLPEGKCLKASPGMSIVSEATSSKCSACCFCNPDLHKTVKDSEKFCPYCNRKKTPVKREEQTNTESDFFTNHRVYQTLTKSDHTHTRTRSRDSDVVSTKCTKTNEKIKQYIPEDHKKSSTSCSKSPSKNLNRPKNVNSLPKSTNGGATVTVNKVAQNHIKSNVDPKADNFKPFRLPSPYTMASTNSYDGTTSPTSSSDSTCPTTPNKCPQLPPSRRQNHLLTRHVHNRRRTGKCHETENAKPAADVVNNNNSNAGNPKTGDQNAGWSVTLAGSYNQDLAPDVEMRLSFPKKYPTESRESDIRQLADNSTFTMAPHPKSFNKSTTTNGNLYADRTIHDDDVMNDNYSRGYHPALPPPGGVVNPKKALTRIVSERTHSQKDFNIPEVNSTHNQMVSRQTAKKAIKHMECSVAVTSATRTISKFARGRRTMSYQTLNTTESSQKITNRDRHARDNSLDLGHISSSRRMSSECQTPSDCQTLSVMGNAIEPEQKPRVPTMSEKDLTRRHNGCFTRNRAFIT